MAKETMGDSRAKDSSKEEKTTKEEKEEERTPKEEMDKEKAKQTRSRTRVSTRLYEHPKTDPGVGVVEDNTSHQNVPHVERANQYIERLGDTANRKPGDSERS